MLFDEISKNKDYLHHEIIKQNKDIYEDIIVQQQRVHEVGEQMIHLSSFIKRKLNELSQVTSGINAKDVIEAQTRIVLEQINDLRDKIDKQKVWNVSTDMHLTKIVPIHITTMLYDALNNNIQTKLKNKIGNYFINVFKNLELNVKSDLSVPLSTEMIFAKGEYVIPQIKEVPEDPPSSVRNSQKFGRKNSIITAGNKNSSTNNTSAFNGEPTDKKQETMKKPGDK